jgi:hypothetical protein
VTLPRRWARALDDHQAAIEACIATGRTVPDAKWNEPRREGKWSPAQQLAHVGLAYQMVLDGLDARPPKPLLPPLRQFVLRTFFLPWMIRGDNFRRGVPAPMELLPAGQPDDRPSLEALLRTRASRCVSAMEAAFGRGVRRVPHPYFGAVPLLSMLRLGTAHTRHHTHLMARAAEASIRPQPC